MAATTPLTVEDRLLQARLNIAIIIRLVHAEALANDGTLNSAARNIATDSSWCLLRLAEDAYGHILASSAVMGDTLSADAPELP